MSDLVTINNPVKLKSYVTSPKVDERVKRVQARLDELGYRDIKFTWNYDGLSSGEFTLDQVTTKACDAIESFLNGEGKDVVFNDSKKKGDVTWRTTPSKLD